uniref:Type-4 uracil-DNA glycosylase n=1 Tax=viral metagenome TaxID=1070528 RepID=A0A6M3J2H4_9ZZZZ
MGNKDEKLLEILAEKVKACTRCELRQGCSAPVPGLGNPHAKYLLIGEAPGREEDRAGIPFIGDAGKRLNDLLERAGIDPNDCYFSNTVRCRPPKNRDPRKKELMSCVGFLEEEISTIKPEYIITLGRIPLSLFSPYGIKQLHGTMMEVDFEQEVKLKPMQKLKDKKK